MLLSSLVFNATYIYATCYSAVASNSAVYSYLSACDSAFFKLKKEQKWLMEFHFHPEECQVLHITKCRNPITSTYTVHGHPLKAVPSAKYLGIELTNNLSWNKHVDNTTRKGMKSLGFLRRNLRKCSRGIKTTCYNTLGRPIVEYASCVWDPHTKKNSAKVESIQHSATRYM